MGDFAISMVRAAGITDAEAQRRIGAAFQVLWDLAEKQKAGREFRLGKGASRPTGGDADISQHQSQYNSGGDVAQGGRL